MLRVAFVSVVLLLAFAPLVSPAAAQSRWSVTPFAGALLTDDDLAGEGDGELEFLDDPSLPPSQVPGIRSTLEVENAALFGVRVGYRLDDSWSGEASLGYASFEVGSTVAVTPVGPDAEVVRFRLVLSDHDLYLWEGAVRYSFGGERLRPFLVGGVGGATMSSSFPVFGGLEELDETTTDLAFVLGAGARWDYREGFGIRLDLRDHLQRCDRPCLGDETLLHQVELSAGIEIEL